MRSDEVLRPLVIEQSLEEAEHLLSTLRNAGIAVRPSTVETEEELEQLLAGRPLDIVLLSASHPDFSIRQVANAVAQAGRDIPILALLDDYGLDPVLAALAAGATDAVSADSDEQLERVVRREAENLRSRRRTRLVESSLRESEQRMHALLDSSRDAIAYVHEGMHVFANPAYLALFDYDGFEELEGLPILDMVVAEDAGKLKEVLKQLSKDGEQPGDAEVRLALPDGRRKEAVMEFSPASIEGEPCTQIVLRDRSLDPEAVGEMRDLKTHDLVTGLHNRQFMLREIGDAITSVLEGGGSHALVLVEIDRFREVLDRVGLAGMDVVLGDVAQIIESMAGEERLVGRLGDSAFGILYRGAGLDEARALGEELRAAIEGHISEVDGESLTFTGSVGVARLTEAVSSAQDLLSMAVSAALQASQKGGNAVEVHEPARQAGGEQDDALQWVERVRTAIDENQLLLVYQPIVSLHGSEDRFYEVTARLPGENGEEIAAEQFMPHIADHELAIKLDQWVIQHAVLALKKVREEGDKAVTSLFLKLSSQTINRPEVLPWLAKILRKHRLGGDALVFEAPESRLMTNLKPARQFLKGLRQLHCRFAVEQFGSGLNSFQILKHLPADFLKIDRSFMQDLPRNEESQQRIREITEQAHAQGKTTIAEFVEDAASMSLLWQAGVNYVQGSFLQEPEKVLAYEFD